MNRKKISGVLCAVENCKSSKRLNVRLFKLPANHKNYQKWILNCNLKNTALKRIFICEKHFETECFTKRGIKKYAIPTLNLPHLPAEDSDGDVSMVSILPLENFPEIEENWNKLNTSEDLIEMDNLNQTLIKSQNVNHNSTMDVMTLQEISCLPEPTRTIESDIEIAPCKTCLRNIQNENYYRLNYNKLVKLVKYKNNEILVLKRKCINFTRKINRSNLKIASILKIKTSIDTAINNLDISENAKNFCKMLTSSRPKNQKWPDEQKILAQNIFYKSSSTYKYLRDCLVFNLPHKSSLVRWQPIKHLCPGFDDSALLQIKEKLNSMSIESKQAVLMFDEIHIKSDLVYNIHSDQIDGFVDYGQEREPDVGKLICCFIIRGIFTNWKFVLSYFVSKNSIFADKLFLLIQENLAKCSGLGINVRAIICDQGPNNRKCLNMFGITIDRPLFLNNGSEVAGLYDIPHLIKSVRNTLIKSDINSPDGLISWKVVIELYNLESSSITKCCPKITAKHIYPNNSKKMRVKLATQIFSRSVVAGIKTAVQLKKNSSSNEKVAVSTYKFFEKFDRLFDCLNSKVKYHKNKFRCSYTPDTEVNRFLDYMIEYISQITIVNKVTVYCFKGLIQTIKGIQIVSKKVLSENIGIHYILTSRFNQDPVENLFAQIRAANGNNRNPSVHDFNHNIARITTVKILTPFSNITNCENDLDVLLENVVAESNENEYINDVNIGNFDDQSEISENFFNLDVPLQEEKF